MIENVFVCDKCGEREELKLYRQQFGYRVKVSAEKVMLPAYGDPGDTTEYAQTICVSCYEGCPLPTMKVLGGDFWDRADILKGLFWKVVDMFSRPRKKKLQDI